MTALWSMLRLIFFKDLDQGERFYFLKESVILCQTRQSYSDKTEWQTFIEPPFSATGIIMEYHLKMPIMDKKRNTDRER